MTTEVYVLLFYIMRNKHFSIQTDETTDCNGIGHLIAYVQYVEDTTINEDMFFCKPIKRRATAKEAIKIVDGFMREKKHKIVIMCWSTYGRNSHNCGKINDCRP
jgi:hypothetical protein